MRFRSHFFKRYQSFFSVRFEMWENRRCGWRTKEIFPAMKKIVADIDRYSTYVLEFKKLKLELDKSKIAGLDTSTLKTKMSAYDRIIKDYEQKINTNVKQFVKGMKKIFWNLEQIDYTAEAMSDKQLDGVKKLRKVVERKLKVLKKREISWLEKEARMAKGKKRRDAKKKWAKQNLNNVYKKIDAELKRKLLGLNKLFKDLNNSSNSKIDALMKNYVRSLKLRWKDTKWQLKGYYEPGKGIVHVADDQAIRKMKVDAKEVVRFVELEAQILKQLKKAKTRTDFVLNFNNLIKLYSETKEEIGNIHQFERVLIYRFKRVVEELEQKTRKGMSETEIKEVRVRFKELDTDIDETLRDIEEQSRLLMNEAAAVK